MGGRQRSEVVAMNCSHRKEPSHYAVPTFVSWWSGSSHRRVPSEGVFCYNYCCCSLLITSSTLVCILPWVMQSEVFHIQFQQANAFPTPRCKCWWSHQSYESCLKQLLQVSTYMICTSEAGHWHCGCRYQLQKPLIPPRQSLGAFPPVHWHSVIVWNQWNIVDVRMFCVEVW